MLPGNTCTGTKSEWLKSKGFLSDWIRHENNENRTNIALKTLAIPAGLEPATRGVEIRYSIQLSYGTVPRPASGEAWRSSTMAHMKNPRVRQA
jgi:hypothetical protein